MKLLDFAPSATPLPSPRVADQPTLPDPTAHDPFGSSVSIDDASLAARLAEAQPEDLRLVVIDSPITSWHRAETRALFSRMIELKLSGFGDRHAPGFLPLATGDFIATHVLSCIETTQGLLPLSGFWSLDDQRCEQLNLPFAAEGLARSAGASHHAEVLAQRRRRRAEAGVRTSYIASWTMHPATRDNPRLRDALREHLTLGHVRVSQERGPSDLVIGATLRFKVDRLVAPLGYRPLDQGGVPLPNIRVPHLHHADVQLMVRPADVSVELPAASLAFQRAWDSRVVY